MKINLEQLVQLFGKSAANEELPKPIRQFAAQLILLSAHVDRVDAKINSVAKALKALEAKQDGEVAELAQHLIDARGESAPATAAAPPVQQQGEDEPMMDEEDQAKAMAEQVILETEAEAAALAKAPITPIRPNGGAKAAVEDAS